MKQRPDLLWTRGMGTASALLILLLGGCGPEGVDEALTAEGVSWELAEFRSSTLSEILYEYALTVPEGTGEEIRGSVKVTLRRSDPRGHPLIFDFLHPQERVSAVRVNDSAAAFQAVNDHLLVPVPGWIQSDSLQVTIDFIAGDESLNRNPDFLYALFVPDRARYSLPVFDQPNLKARFAVSLDLPLSWTGMANGRQMREEADATRRRLQFAPSDPLPTYLFTFVAGRFEKVVERRGERVFEFMHRETDQEKVARNVDALLSLHVTALDWLEEYTGIPYPFQKLGFVAIPSFQYGGMEHPGAVFYRAGSLFLEENATQSQYLGRASLIAHETAHMWFGDLVTMRWFDDVWTKEVFANFMAAKIVHPSFPEINHELRFLLAHHPRAYGVDRTEGANPIRQPLENLREAGTLYGAIIYQKAPVVMRQLEALTGEEVFREGIREYLADHSYANASWPDLITILDPLVPDDLTSWSRVWVEEPDRPTVWVDWSVGADGKLEDLVLRQEDPAGKRRVWPQPLSLAFGYGERVDRVPLRFLEERVDLIEGAPGPEEPDFILPDGWGEGYGLFRLDQRSREHLLGGVDVIRDPVVRGAVWLTLWDGVLEGEVRPDAFLDLALSSLQTEREEQILQRILDDSGKVFWNLLAEEARTEMSGEVEEVLWEGVERARSTSVRTAFFRAYRDLATTPGGVERLEGLWRGTVSVPGLELSETDRTALAGALALRKVEGWEEILDTEVSSIGNPDRRARFEFLRPSLDPDPGAREAFFRTLADPVNREKEPWVLEALSNLHHPLRRGHAEAFVLPSLELLEEIQRTGDIFFPARWVGTTLGNHNSREVAETVRDFLASRPDYPYRLRLKILQAADPLFRAVEIHGGHES